MNKIARHREPSWDLDGKELEQIQTIFFLTKEADLSPANVSPNELVEKPGVQGIGTDTDVK